MALTRDQVVDAAVALTDAEGLDALSLRTLATRLGVQAPTLYWHVENKAELTDAVADRIMDDAIEAIGPAGGEWREWLLTSLVALRGALLQHRDGARIVAGARTALRRADFTEALMAYAVGEGIELQRARIAILAVERYTIGYVLEEQAPVDETTTPDLDELTRRLPTSVRAIGEYFAAGHTADDLFVAGARQVLGLTQE